MTTYTVTTSPQTVSDGSKLQTFTNDGDNWVYLAWSPGQATVLFPGGSAVTGASSVMKTGASTSAYTISGEASLVVADVPPGPPVGTLAVENQASANTLGTVTGKFEVFDAAGASLGFVALYDAITTTP